MLITDHNSPDFNSYASVEECKSYALKRGLTLSHNETTISELLFQAMDYLEGINWKGTPSNENQSYSWPRVGVVKDSMNIPSDTIPKQIKEAQCYLAIKAQEMDLQPASEGGSEILSESIAGVISLNYAQGSNSSKPNFSFINGLLRELSYSNNTAKLVRG